MLKLIKKIGEEKSVKIEFNMESIGDITLRKKFEKQLRLLGLENLNIPSYLVHFEHQEILKQLLLAKQKCRIRIYMLSAFDLSSRDNGSASDPYLVLSCNNKKYNEREHYQLD